jgi:oligopeptide/dipeptide ABC transporter ATP-binding protein
VTGPLLEVDRLVKVFPMTAGPFRRVRGQLRAVDEVSLRIGRGETLGLVGESGSGKSTVARCLLRLSEPTGGRIAFDGGDVRAMNGEALRHYRRQAQILFQDPFGSLNPRMTVEGLISEPLLAHGLYETRRAARRRVAELLDLVGVGGQQAGRFPAEFSGGQRQRIAIARVLACQPRLIILDEPVAALDVSVAAQILNLLADLQQQLGVAYLFISHDLSLVRHLCHRVAVMYLGRIVEVAATAELFAAPAHPYTQALLSAVPLPDPVAERSRRRIPLAGEVPSTLDVPTGCRFHPRCFKAEARCHSDQPPLDDLGSATHPAACWYAEPRPVLAEGVSAARQRPDV